MNNNLQTNSHETQPTLHNTASNQRASKQTGKTKKPNAGKGYSPKPAPKMSDNRLFLILNEVFDYYFDTQVAFLSRNQRFNLGLQEFLIQNNLVFGISDCSVRVRPEQVPQRKLAHKPLLQADPHRLGHFEYKLLEFLSLHQKKARTIFRTAHPLRPVILLRAQAQ